VRAILDLVACSLGILLMACSGDAGPQPSPAKGTTKPRTSSSDASVAGACTDDAACGAGGAASAGNKGLCTATGDCEEVIPVTTAMHVEGPITYGDPPPAGGQHNSCWTTWGVHDQAVGAEHWVHNLEHGGVVFLYHCAKACTSEVSQMAAFVRGHRLAVLTQYDAMPRRFAIVAWGYRLQTDTLDLPAFESFYAAHVDHGPESIASDPPSSCP
jgi:hypothetical protein